MLIRLRLPLFVIILITFIACKKEQKVAVLSAPADELYTSINKSGRTVIPNGRFITPAGKSIVTAPHPFGLTLSKDGTIAITANSGTNPLSITIIRELYSDNPVSLQIPPGPASDEGILESVFMGIAISPDNQTVYASGGQTNKIYLFNSETGESKGIIDCSTSEDGLILPDGYIGDIVLSDDGETLYAATYNRDSSGEVARPKGITPRKCFIAS